MPNFSDVSSVVHLLPRANEGFNTTLGSTISSGASTVPLNDVTDLTNGSTIVLIIEPGTSNEQTFTGIVDVAGSRITNVVWTRGSNVSHSAGSTIVDYITGTAFNMLARAFGAEHKDNGHHKNIVADSLTVGGVDIGGLVPPGVVLPYAATAAPTGFLLSQGQSLLRADYSALFAAIGTAFGAADGTHFSLPDLRQRFPLGKAASGTGSTFAASGGAIDHTHPLSDNGGAAIYVASGTIWERRVSISGWNYNQTINGSADTNNTGGGSLATGLVGNTDGANPPFIVLNYIIKT